MLISAFMEAHGLPIYLLHARLAEAPPDEPTLVIISSMGDPKNPIFTQSFPLQNLS